MQIVNKHITDLFTVYKKNIIYKNKWKIDIETDKIELARIFV